MYAHEYQVEAARTKSTQFRTPFTSGDQDILHAAIGIATEAGELLDAVKKVMFYGKKPDVTNIKEELGDVLWYIAIACNAMDITIEQLMEQNINKLRVRFPEKFTESHALQRDVNAEREALENSGKD